MRVTAFPKPEDFASFWHETRQKAESLDLDVSWEEEKPSDLTHHCLRTFRFRGADGQTRYGWYADPPEKPKGAFLWLAPYSRWSMLPNEYGTRPGFASLSFNFHGEAAFHQETYHPSRGYFAEGAGSPETWIFRRMFLDSYLMARLLNELHPSEKGLGAMGMSQGGGLAIWLGAYCSLIRAVVADMPFLAGMEWVLSQKMPRYPLKELADFIESAPENREALVRTLSYFDTLTQAGECYTPTLVTQGKRDPAVRPDQVKAIFEALPGTKELVEIDWGHDWHPSMVERNQEWLERYLT